MFRIIKKNNELRRLNNFNVILYVTIKRIFFFLFDIKVMFMLRSQSVTMKIGFSYFLSRFRFDFFYINANRKENC